MDVAPSISGQVHGGSHRVQFSAETEKGGHDSDIFVQTVNPSAAVVHLGFLQLRRRYEVKFKFQSDAQWGQLAIRNADPPNLNLRIVKLQKLDEQSNAERYTYEITLELFAHKEKLLKEKVILESCSNASRNSLTLELNARVLGKGKGTPSLKKGIRCVGVEMEDDSEFSDWKGF